jgi:hypothetical protein|tara:strand:+ start:3267 stop:3506 length:240 start_codon:yes stop_codon:yes gene_type:complete
MAKSEKRRIEELYSKTLLSVEKIKDRVAEIENKMGNDENTPTDLQKYAVALNNLAKTQQVEIKTLKDLAAVIEAMENDK